MYRTQQDWIEEYQKKDALWIHDGNPARPHALLTSGKHSNGFFNSGLVVTDEPLLTEAASKLLEEYVRLAPRGNNLYSINDVHCVIGPQTGATKLAELLSKQVSIFRKDSHPTSWASPAKHQQDGKKTMVFDRSDINKFKHRQALICEDVITTGGSIEFTVDAILEEEGSVLPFILALVNRSGLTGVGGRRIISLIDHHMPIWEPEECPLCKAGSEAIRPKGENWTRLNASY